MSPVDRRHDCVVVTGAGGDIGRATALRIARDGVSAIGLVDIDPVGLETTRRALEHDAPDVVSRLHVVDVADWSAMEAAIDDCRHLGVISGFAAIAGMIDFEDPLTLSEARWRRMMDVNLSGVFAGVRRALSSMMEAGFGRVVICTSIGAHDGTADHVHYAAAKAGCTGLAQALRKRVGAHGVTINLVAPGGIVTQMTDRIPETALARFDTLPVGRKGSADDVAHAVSFLMDPRSGFITGQTLHVNGGAYV